MRALQDAASATREDWTSPALAALGLLPPEASRDGAMSALHALALLQTATAAVRTRVVLAVLDEAFNTVVDVFSAGVLTAATFEAVSVRLEEAHRCLTAAAQRRLSRKRTPVPWDRVPLGTAPDTVFGKVFGVTPQAVRSARAKTRRIDAYSEYVDWDSMPLGEVPDTHLARETGRRVATVWQARQLRHIAPWLPPWATMQWPVERLGNAPDTVLARELDVPVDWVAGARERLGVPAYPTVGQRIDWDRHPLGKVPHAALARALGVSETTVARECRKRELQAFRGAVLSQEGEPLHSRWEAMLDGVLHAHGIPHEHQVAVGPGRRSADFRLGHLHVEVVGMAGTPFYDEHQRSKRREYDALGIAVLWLSVAQVTDLYFAQDPLPPLRWRPRASCPQCGRPMGRRGTCPRCWPRGRFGNATCQLCGEPMKLNSIAQRFHRDCAARGRHS